MNEVEVIQVIRTTLTRRGVSHDPVRRVEQFWSLDGKLLAENDPQNPTITKRPVEAVGSS